MFHCTIMIVPLFHRQMFCCSPIRCSTVPTTDVLLFHHQMFHFSTISVPPSDVPLLTISVFCSTIRSSTVPPFLFHFSTTSCSVSLFHHQMFYCSTIRCSTVQPSDILLFQHEIIHSSIMIVWLFHHQMFRCSTIRCSTVPPSDVPFFCHNRSSVPPSDIPLFHHDFSTVPPSDCLLYTSELPTKRIV